MDSFNSKIYVIIYLERRLKCTHSNRGNYGAKNETLMSLRYMLESMEDFVKMLKSEAGSQEEMQLIHEYTQKISQM